MNKQSFMAMFPGEDPAGTARLFETIEAAFLGRPVVSNEFYSPSIWSKLEKQPGALPPEAGFYDLLDGDRRLFASPLYLAADKLKIAKVCNNYPARPLAHRDYLGALMNLGIRREKFADLLLGDDCCYIPMVPEIMGYVLENLVKVGNNGVTVSQAEPLEVASVGRRYEELLVLVPSLRLDALVSELTKRSRSQAEELVRTGQVQVNYQETKNRSEAVGPGDVLTIRGYGKYRLGEVSGESRKGRLRLAVAKYK